MQIKGIRTTGTQFDKIKPWRAVEFTNASIAEDPDEPDVGVIGLAPIPGYEMFDFFPPRIPLSLDPGIVGEDAVAEGTSNLVGISLSPHVSGNFTGVGGSDPGFWFGLSNFAHVQEAPGDGEGLTTLVGAVMELDFLPPDGTFNNAIGLLAELAFFGDDAGATILQGESLRVGAPKRKNGATAGDIVNAYGLFVEEVDLGTNSNFSLFVAGGITRVGGRLDIHDNISNAGTGDTTINSGFSAADGALLALRKDGNGGHARIQLHDGASFFEVHDGSASKFKVLRDGTVTRVKGVDVSILAGTGTPEGNVTAPVGSIYMRTNGGAGTSIYIKESGSGNTGWQAK